MAWIAWCRRGRRDTTCAMCRARSTQSWPAPGTLAASPSRVSLPTWSAALPMRSGTMVEERLRDIVGPAGRLEVLLDQPAATARAAAVFAHPHPLYGGTMHTKAVFQAAKALAR